MPNDQSLLWFLGGTPVEQKRTGEGVGQCTEATYASILNVPLESIPDLIGADGKRSLQTWIKLYEYLLFAHNRKVFTIFLKEHSAANGEEFFTRLCLKHRWFSDLPWDRMAYVIGGKKDGVGHMCVGHFGEIIWDPNPNKGGLDTIDVYEFLLSEEEMVGGGLLTKEQFNTPSSAHINLTGENVPPNCKVWEEE